MIKQPNIKYIPAKSLYLVVFISFVISVILLLLISNSYFTQIEVLKYQYLKKLVDRNHNEINISLSGGNSSSIFDGKESGEIQNNVEEYRWGGYTIIHSESSWKELKHSKAVLVGDYLFQDEIKGLILADKGKYLSIAGDTKLSGNTYLPALGIRSVYIDGKPYSGSQLVYGKEITSKKELPKLSNELLSWINGAFKGNYGLSDSLGRVSDLQWEKQIHQSFSSNALVFEDSDEIRLNNIELSGKIIIRSDSAIYIGSSLLAENIIVIAPIIVVEPGFSGSVQVFARDSLFIDKNAVLRYPSFAAAYNSESSKVFAFLEENSNLEGGMLCASGMLEGDEAELVIKKGVVVHGIAYSSGSVSHQGEVYGSLFLEKFVLKTKRGYYENHLLDAVIDPESQYKEMVVPGIFDSGYEKGIINSLN